MKETMYHRMRGGLLMSDRMGKITMDGGSTGGGFPKNDERKRTVKGVRIQTYTRRTREEMRFSPISRVN